MRSANLHNSLKKIAESWSNSPSNQLQVQLLLQRVRPVRYLSGQILFCTLLAVDSIKPGFLCLAKKAALHLLPPSLTSPPFQTGIERT